MTVLSKNMIFIVFSLGFAPWAPVQGAVQCSGIFGEALLSPAQRARQFVPHLTGMIRPDNESPAVRYWQFSDAKSDGSPNTYTRFNFQTQGETGLHRFTIHYLENRQKADRMNQVRVDLEAEKRFETEIDRSINFVMGVYSDRRAQWSPEFIQKLRAMAFEYKNESTYINVEAGVPQGNSQIVATIRLIHEKDGLLPMEKYLGIRVRVDSNAVKIEPGNYAIQNEATDIGLIETSIGMIAKDRQYQTRFNREPFYMTYADSFSERLYASMGFKPVTPDMIENIHELTEPFKLDPKTKAVRILRGGTWWCPMYEPHDEFIQMLENKIDRVAHKRGGEDLVRQMQNYLKSASRIDTDEKVLLALNPENTNQSGTLRLYRRGNGRLELELFKGQDSLKEEQFNGMLLQYAINIPLPAGEVVPELPEFLRQTARRAWNKNYSLYDKGVLSIHTSQPSSPRPDDVGVLKIDGTSYVQVTTDVEIQIGPDMRNPGKVHFRQLRGQKLQEEFYDFGRRNDLPN